MTNFGREMSCTTSMRTGRTITGARLVAEAAFRRLSTPRGMLRGGEEEASYGFDLTSKIGSITSAADIEALPGQISSELRKDERIESVTVRVTRQHNGPAIYLLVDVSAETTEGPFALQLGVNEVTAALLGLRAED